MSVETSHSFVVEGMLVAIILLRFFFLFFVNGSLLVWSQAVMQVEHPNPHHPSAAYLSAASVCTALSARLLQTDAESDAFAVVADVKEMQGAERDSASHINVLEPLLFLNGKVFSAATGIAYHMTEPIFRLVVPHEQPAANTSENATLREGGPMDATSSPPCVGMLASQRRVRTPGRYVFQVGSHVVFEPPTSFCSCAAFKFQVVNKQDIRACKHIVALQMALRLDLEMNAKHHEEIETAARTLPQEDDGSVGEVGGTTPLAPQQRVKLWSHIRERYISVEDFIALMSSPT